MDNQEVMGLLKEIADSVDAAKWTSTPLPVTLTQHDSSIECFTGQAPEWVLTVISWDGTKGALSTGMRGYDGTALHIKRGVVMRLPHELAERLFKIAERAV